MCQRDSLNFDHLKPSAFSPSGRQRAFCIQPNEDPGFPTYTLKNPFRSLLASDSETKRERKGIFNLSYTEPCRHCNLIGPWAVRLVASLAEEMEKVISTTWFLRSPKHSFRCFTRVPAIPAQFIGNILFKKPKTDAPCLGAKSGWLGCAIRYFSSLACILILRQQHTPLSLQKQHLYVD